MEKITEVIVTMFRIGFKGFAFVMNLLFDCTKEYLSEHKSEAMMFVGNIIVFTIMLVIIHYSLRVALDTLENMLTIFIV